MLRTSARIRIQEILTRLSKGNEVTLEERIYINKYASRYQNVLVECEKQPRLKGNR